MSVPTTADAVICGAGIAGIAVAHALAVRHGWRDVVLVDERAPMSLTSDKSTEAYRNWWPGPDDAMVRLMNRSIDLLEEWADASGNRFHLNRRGYLYTTADPDRARRFEDEAALAAAQGAGPVRVYRSRADSESYRPSAHRGYGDHPEGADLFLDRDAIRHWFPWLAPDICGVLHARRCGWFSGQQLGMYLLDEARAAGAVLVDGRVADVWIDDGEVSAVLVRDAQGEEHRIATSRFVNAAGPYAPGVGRMVQADLPLFSEAHYKVAIEDVHGALDRDTGLVILDDAQTLAWPDDEREELANVPELRRFIEPMPAGIHLRPEGYGPSKTVLMLWDYHGDHRFDEPQFPMPADESYAEIVLRGMAALVPGFAAYLERLPAMYVDGGYYTKTEESRPLIGAAGARGAYVCAGFSGFGLMAAPAAAELLALRMVGETMPSHAVAFSPDRYDDADYRARVATWGGTGQL
ncbi:MAG TPA: FAD-binding oxidoreductase [Gemmatimonas sp.]|uniref:NAD(P)/FAD-dependent oxidoreductase n=1 Tax=Gemmatimonas sp. TaxID=1962908 RepID=UPI002EDA75A1